MTQHLTILLRSTAHCVEHQAGLLTLQNITTNLLAKHLLGTVAVEQIILKLERQTKLQRIAVNLAAVILRGVAQNSTNHRRARQQDRGLELNHIHILRHSDLLQMLEVHIILLTLAHLQRHLGEDVEDAGQLLIGHIAKQLIGINHHCITREDGYILAPLGKYRWLATTHQGVIHNVVVQKSEIVEHLHRRGCRHSLTHIAAEGLAAQKQQCWTYALATTRHRVKDWLVQ